MTADELSRLVVNCRTDRFDVYIARPSSFGNPYSHMEGTLAEYIVATREEAILRYEEWLMGQPELVERVKRELKNKVLGCFCRPRACHGDILVRIANDDVE